MLTIIIRYNPDMDEYRVPGIRGEVDAYYTDDADDAVRTCEAIWKEALSKAFLQGVIKIKIKEVTE